MVHRGSPKPWEEPQTGAWKLEPFQYWPRVSSDSRSQLGCSHSKDFTFYVVINKDTQRRPFCEPSAVTEAAACFILWEGFNADHLWQQTHMAVSPTRGQHEIPQRQEFQKKKKKNRHQQTAGYSPMWVSGPPSIFRMTIPGMSIKGGK